MDHFLSNISAFITAYKTWVYAGAGLAVFWFVFTVFAPKKYGGLRADIADKMDRAEKEISKSRLEPGTVVILPDGKVGVVKSIGTTMLGAGSGIPTVKPTITVDIPGPGESQVKNFSPEELQIYHVPKG